MSMTKVWVKESCLHHDKHKALVAIRESLTQTNSSCKLLHFNSLQNNSALVCSVGYLRISDWACFTLLKHIFEAVGGVLDRKKTQPQTTNKNKPLLIGKFSSIFLWDTVGGGGLYTPVWSGSVSVCYRRAALDDESTFRDILDDTWHENFSTNGWHFPLICGLTCAAITLCCGPRSLFRQKNKVCSSVKFSSMNDTSIFHHF